MASSAVHVFQLSFLITLQEKIDKVTVERVENVGEEECVEIKIEEDYVQLVKSEQEVSDLLLK
jgi:hypothetical protein